MNIHLEPGTKVKLSKLTGSEIPYEELLTKVEAEVIAVDEDRIEVSLLNLNKNFAEIEFIRIGILLNMCFVGKDALYKVVVEVEQIKEVSKLILVQQGKVQRIQRRKAARIPASEKINYRGIEDDNFKFETNGSQDFSRKAKVTNISSVGLKMKVNSLEGLSLAEVLGIELPFLNDGVLKGEIVRIEEENMYLGVEFIDLPEEINQRLTRWILKKEEEFIEQNKRELSN